MTDTHTRKSMSMIKKYRLTHLPHTAMFEDQRLSFTERGVLGYLTTQYGKNGYPVFTVLNVPQGELRTHAEMIAVLDRLVETGWAEVVE